MSTNNNHPSVISELENNRDVIQRGETARKNREYLVVKAFRAGVTVITISKSTGLSRTAIYGMLHKAGAVK